MKSALTNMLVVLGVGIISYGLYLIYVPGAFIFLGVAAIIVGITVAARIPDG